jgi:nitroreductase
MEAISMEDVKQRILDAYNFRHACKEFDPQKRISEEDFNFILEIARLSPSSFGFEPWKFLIIQKPELRDKIKSAAWGAQSKLPEASHFVVILARTIADMKYDSEYIMHLMKDIHHIPEDAMKIRANSYKGFVANDFKLLESDRAIFDWACKQSYIALGNMITAAAQIGIDSCPIEGFNREKLEDLLEQEGVLDRKRFGLSVMVAFGYRAKEQRPKTRQDMTEIVEWV